MKIELFKVPNDIHGKALKIFLEKNKIKFHEISADDINVLQNVVGRDLTEKISVIKVTYSHGTNVMQGFNEHYLNQQIVEHIKKYNIKHLK
ncbi:MAG: hypothetical protein KJ600_05365 [Nanoarchaeota archaeon]|nr:hypothetical protein [Nanoarchaeota archaeon]MBU1103956.1 hypothetical protein [Nanoarchaeota archaeon]